MFGIIGTIIFGLVVGVIAKLLMPGKDPGGIIITIILGIVGSVLGRWIGQALNERWPRMKGASWWAEEGSNIAIDNESYLNNAFNYVFDQRTS